jgi:transcriptional regulator with XRE-family HTH domain
MTLKTFLQEQQITQAETAEALGIDSSTLSLKLSGQRPWFEREINAVLAFLRQRTGQSVTFEQLFGAENGLPAAANE